MEGIKVGDKFTNGYEMCRIEKVYTDKGTTYVDVSHRPLGWRSEDPYLKVRVLACQYTSILYDRV